MFSNGLIYILMLTVSNFLMITAWYGHLKLREIYSWFGTLPLIGVIIFSWGIAFFEYCLVIPANRIGFKGSGGPFDILELKVLQEVITLVVFTIFSMLVFKLQLRWNHLVSFLMLIGAVYFAFRK